jgi:hypothetical protein
MQKQKYSLDPHQVKQVLQRMGVSSVQEAEERLQSMGVLEMKENVEVRVKRAVAVQC